MIIKSFICGPIQNNTFIISCEKTKKALVIDPAFGSFSKVAGYIHEKEFFLEKILLTHGHWDHITDVLLLKEEFSCLVCMHKADLDLLKSPQNTSFFSAIPIPDIRPDIFLQDNEKIALGNIEILVIHTPGHTPGCVCFYIEKEEVLFSGDTLFKGSFGRVDFPNSNSKSMAESLKKLSNLPSDVKVYPGHGSQTMIGNESWLAMPEKFI